MSDLIDRQQAIDDIWTVSPLAHLDREWIDRWLRQLPPANTSETPNSSDTISRAKAIEAVKRLSLGETDAMRLAMRIGDYLERLSPAQLGTNLAEVGTDCISRQSAIDAFNTNINELVVAGKENADSVEMYLNRVINKIKQLPPIQPEPHWIPVTERLPQAGESVMICDAYGDICIGHRTRSGYYFPDLYDDKIKDVRAWCELPEPYKGVTE